MDFDFSDIAVPFRMQPGLRKLAPGARQLTPLAANGTLYREKQSVVRAGQARLCVPGFDPAPALAAVARHAAAHGIPCCEPLELAFEEDLAILDGATGTLPWLAVCVPSHWAPEDKLGQSLAQVHAPVADARLLQSASRHLVELATGGDAWERFVWTVTPSDRYDQHPRRHARQAWPVEWEGGGIGGIDDEGATGDFIASCQLRCERQTFLPVGGASRQAVFTIRVMLQPLAHALDAPWKVQRLHDSIASMSDAVLSYKGLAPARVPLLRWLARRGAAQ